MNLLKYVLATVLLLATTVGASLHGQAQGRLSTPKVKTSKMECSPILDTETGRFNVTGLRIVPPVVDGDTADVELTFEVQSASIQDKRDGRSITVEVYGDPVKQGDTWMIPLVLQGEPPFESSIVSGYITLKIKAKATHGERESRTKLAMKMLELRSR